MPTGSSEVMDTRSPATLRVISARKDVDVRITEADVPEGEAGPPPQAVRLERRMSRRKICRIYLESNSALSVGSTSCLSRKYAPEEIAPVSLVVNDARPLVGVTCTTSQPSRP